MVQSPYMGTPGYEDQIQKNRKWNFAVNLGDVSFVNLAGSFVYATTILPLYASYLTSSKVLIGFVAAMQAVMVYVPQLFTARYAESLERKKPFIVKVSLIERLPYLVLALTILLFPGSPKWAAFLILTLSLATAYTGVGLGGPPWRAMLGKIIHRDQKGRLFGIAIALGGLMGVGGAAISRFILREYAYPTSFGLCFLFAFCAQAVSWTFLTLNREPAQRPTQVAVSLRNYLAQLPSVLRQNRMYSRFLLSQVLVVFGTMGATFYIIFGKFTFFISDTFAATITMVSLFSQSITTPLLGWISDRLGHKSLCSFSSLMGAAAAVMMVFAQGSGWLFPAFILLNLSRSGIRIARPAIIMEFGEPGRVPTFTALSSTLLALPTLLAPLAGGWLIEMIDYRTLFFVAAAFSVSSWLLLTFGVRDPRVSKQSR